MFILYIRQEFLLNLQTVFNFHFPRLNSRAAETASSENASVIAQNTPVGP